MLRQRGRSDALGYLPPIELPARVGDVQALHARLPRTSSVRPGEYCGTGEDRCCEVSAARVSTTTELTEATESADCQISSARSDHCSSAMSSIRVGVSTYVITDVAR
jgi:hypothetical protein